MCLSVDDLSQCVDQQGPVEPQSTSTELCSWRHLARSPVVLEAEMVSVEAEVAEAAEAAEAEAEKEGEALMVLAAA